MRIVSFDPGKTTGVCCLATSSWPPNPSTTFTTNIADDDYEDLMAVWKRLCIFQPLGETAVYSLPYQPPPASMGLAIVIESFRLFPDKARAQIGSDFPSSQVIGQLKLLAYQTGLTTCLHFQNPDIQTMWPVNKLKKFGYTFSGMTAHETSALKHAIHYCRLLQQTSPSSPTPTRPKV